MYVLLYMYICYYFIKQFITKNQIGFNLLIVQKRKVFGEVWYVPKFTKGRAWIWTQCLIHSISPEGNERGNKLKNDRMSFMGPGEIRDHTCIIAQKYSRELEGSIWDQPSIENFAQ